MDAAYGVVASSLKARSAHLERVAHDLAQLSTVSYKPSQTFFSLLQGATAGAPPGPVVLGGQGTGVTQGALRATGRALDVALDGNGFLVVRTGSGERVTRDGRLQLSPNGELQALDGSPLLGGDGQPIRVDPRQGALSIASDGTVKQGSQFRGQLALKAFADPGALPRVGGLRFDATAATAAPLTGGLAQGHLEQSTVDVAASMVELIRINRLYELSLKAASTLSNDLDARALSDVATTR